MSVRAEDCPATELCWDDEKFGVWDCDEEPAPIQVYKNDDDVYVVEKLDVATGTYENIFSLELEDVKKINAAAIYHHTNEDGDDEFFSFAAVQGRRRRGSPFVSHRRGRGRPQGVLRQSPCREIATRTRASSWMTRIIILAIWATTTTERSSTASRASTATRRTFIMMKTTWPSRARERTPTCGRGRSWTSSRSRSARR